MAGWASLSEIDKARLRQRWQDNTNPQYDILFAVTLQLVEIVRELEARVESLESFRDSPSLFERRSPK